MEKRKKNKQIDRVSNLPNSIQNLIVSFLPIKDGIKTRILSKDWRHVCASFSEMNFSKNEYIFNTHTTELFKQLVTQTLHFHDGSLIHKFALHTRGANLPTPLIIEWISFALNHNVNQLYLRFHPGKLDQLPRTLFTCPTLTLLLLSSVDLRLPISFEFPMLKELLLSSVGFHGEKPLDQFISSCPVLEKLSIVSCSWENQVFVNINASTLKLLALSVRNLPPSSINISAANLRKVSYAGSPPDISVETLSSLEDVFFDFSLPITSSDRILDTLCQHAYSIFTGQHRYKILELDGLFFEYLSRIPDLFSHELSSCKTLQSLHLFMACSGDHVYAIMFLLKNCPNLESLNIFFQVKSTSTNGFNMERYSESKELTTVSNLKHLKMVTFYFFKGSQGELDLASCLLGNANVMRVMNIKYSPEVKENEQSQRNISQKLAMFTKASPDLVISFS